MLTRKFPQPNNLSKTISTFYDDIALCALPVLSTSAPIISRVKPKPSLATSSIRTLRLEGACAWLVHAIVPLTRSSDDTYQLCLKPGNVALVLFSDAKKLEQFLLLCYHKGHHAAKNNWLKRVVWKLEVVCRVYTWCRRELAAIDF